MAKNIFIISGPAGAGKSGIEKRLSEIFGAKKIITTSTRAMRPGESEGFPYYFVSKEEFQKKINTGEFIEWAHEQNDNYYGSTKTEIKRAFKSSGIFLWEIEYQGVINAKKLYPNIIAIMINAPLESLERRIRERDGARATPEYLANRMAYTKEWLKHKEIYDYEVVNFDGQQQEAVAKTAEIIKKEVGIA